MIIKCFGSSSKGNFYTLEDSGETLFLECGINIKDIKKGVGFDVSRVKGCLLTHEHLDHSKSASDLIKLGIDVYSSKETLEHINTPSHHKIALEPNESVKIGNFKVIPFEVRHDCDNPYGYLIMAPSGEKIVFATDTYYLKNVFKNIDVYMIECNYDLDTMTKNIESERINITLAKRIMRTHFGFDDVQEFLRSTDIEKTSVIMLLHLSANNSNGEMYKREIQNEFNIETDIVSNGYEWRNEI